MDDSEADVPLNGATDSVKPWTIKSVATEARDLGDATEGRPGLSEPEGEAARIARERQPGARTNALAAAIAEIKELYERESAGLMEPIDALERDHDLPRQRTDNPEPEGYAARM